MCKKWLNNTVLIYSTYNEGKSVVAERFIGTLKGKIYKKWQLMTVYLLNKLVVEYNTCHHSIGKKPIYADYSALPAEIETNSKLLNINLVM